MPDDPIRPAVLSYHSSDTPENRDVKDDAKMSVVAGIVALCIFWVPLIGFLPALAAIWCGRDARRLAAIAQVQQTAILGMTLGFVAIGLNVAFTFLILMGSRYIR